LPCGPGCDEQRPGSLAGRPAPPLPTRLRPMRRRTGLTSRQQGWQDAPDGLDGQGVPDDQGGRDDRDDQGGRDGLSRGGAETASKPRPFQPGHGTYRRRPARTSCPKTTTTHCRLRCRRPSSCSGRRCAALARSSRPDSRSCRRAAPSVPKSRGTRSSWRRAGSHAPPACPAAPRARSCPD
jgi:hypothetical protein